MQEFNDSMQDSFEGNLKPAKLHEKEFGIIKKSEIVINSSRFFQFW